jgi:ribonuclease P protein component
MPVRIVRMKKRREFLATAAARKKWVAPGFVLQARRRGPDEAADGDGPGDTSADRPVRLGFTASKKVGGAVQRNRAKRRLRAAADRVLPDRAAPGWDLVLIARQATPDRPFDELTRDLARALDRLGAARRNAAAAPADGDVPAAQAAEAAS